MIGYLIRDFLIGLHSLVALTSKDVELLHGSKRRVFSFWKVL